MYAKIESLTLYEKVFKRQKEEGNLETRVLLLWNEFHNINMNYLAIINSFDAI